MKEKDKSKKRKIQKMENKKRKKKTIHKLNNS